MKRIISKHIIIVATTNFPFDTSSANLLRYLSLGLTASGKNIHVLLQRGNIYKNPTHLNKRTNQIDNIHFTFCSFKTKPRLYLFKILDVLIGVISVPVILMIKKIQNRADVVITYTGYAYQDLPNILICKILRIPVIKYSVDWYNKEDIVRKWWLLPKWWSFILEMNYLDKLLSKVIVISKLLYQHYEKIGFSYNELLLVPNLIDIDKFKSVLRNPFSDQIITIGYSGTTSFVNGIDDLIKAFVIVHSDYPHSRLMIIGDIIDGENEKNYFSHLVLENKISDAVIFTGRVASESIPKYLEECDILVLARKPSQFAEAGFPTKLGEYFACKRPVVATKVGDMPFYFTDKTEMMLAEPNNPGSIANNIIYLIENKDHASKITENAYNWVLKNLEYKSCGLRLANFIDNN